MVVYPDGRIECTPAELIAYQHLSQQVAQQQTRQIQQDTGSVMAIAGVTPALRHQIMEAIVRYQRSMYRH